MHYSHHNVTLLNNNNKDLARMAKRDVRKGQREVEREVNNLKREEQKIQQEIKRLVKVCWSPHDLLHNDLLRKERQKDGQEASAKKLCKELLNIRSQQERLLSTKSQLSSVSYRATTAVASSTMVDSMNLATRVSLYLLFGFSGWEISEWLLIWPNRDPGNVYH